MKKYRKKPIIVEAIQWNGNTNRQDIFDFVGEVLETEIFSTSAYDAGMGLPLFSLKINSLERQMTANPGDFVIKGVYGEFYLCKPEIFKKTYEPIDN